MKIKLEHYLHLKNEISKLDRDLIHEHAVKVRASGKFKDFNKRMRWDLFYAARLHDWSFDLDYNMDHIDTALRAIMRDLELLYY